MFIYSSSFPLTTKIKYNVSRSNEQRATRLRETGHLVQHVTLTVVSSDTYTKERGTGNKQQPRARTLGALPTTVKRTEDEHDM